MTKRDSDSGILSKLMAEKREQYVAFVDLLGFGARVVRDWADAARAYDGFVSAAADLRRKSHRGRFMPKTLAQVQFWSDAAVIIGDDLPAVAEACQDIQTGALLAGVLVRGGISRGLHAKVDRGGHAFVVSEGLVRAVEVEKQAHHPRVLLDRAVGLDQEGFTHMRSGNSYFMPAEDGECMIVPFVPDSSKREPVDKFAIYDARLDELVRSCGDPRHLPKYEWMRRQLGRLIEHFEELQAMDPINDPD